MTQSEQPLYPKLSSIYNKIMQLAIAVVLIIILMNVLLFNFQQTDRTIEQHFRSIGQEYSAQTAKALAVLSDETLAAKKYQKLAQDYVQSLVGENGVHEALFYGPTGQVVHQSESANTINQLYGVADFNVNTSDEFIPVISEVRDQKQQLLGYLRLTLDKAHFVDKLNEANSDTSELFRALLVLAGIAGFFLTRGFNRFSRQGFRMTPNAAKNDVAKSENS